MSKTEVSGKQLKDGSVELVDLSPALAGDINTLKSDVATLQTDVAAKADAGTLATVATTGSYNDLSNKPSIPSISGLASETYVDTKVADLVNSAPATLDTLKELSDALGADANFATTVAGQIGDVEVDVAALDVRVTATEADIAALQGASAPNLSDLGEVAITSPTSGQVLKYNGTGWANAADSTFSGDYNDLSNKPSLFSGSYTDLADKPTLFDGAYSSLTGAPSLATVATSGSYSDLSNKPTIPSSIDDLSDVTITSPSADQILKYNGTAWVNGAAPSSFSGSYTDLTNKPTLASFTTLTSPASGNYLRYNGTAWVNSAIQSADLPVANGSTVGIVSAGDQVFSGRKSLQGGATIKAPWVNQTGLNVQPYSASQSANVFQVEDSGGYDIFAVNSSGHAVLKRQNAYFWQLNTNGSGALAARGIATCTTYSGTEGLWFLSRTGVGNTTLEATPLISIDLASTNIGFNTAQANIGAQLHVTSNTAATKGLVVKGAASQSANLFEAQNSSGTALFVVNSTGSISIKSSNATMMTIGMPGNDQYGIAVGPNVGGGTYATWIGANAGQRYATGTGNVGVGTQAIWGQPGASGSYNTGVGWQPGYGLTSGQSNSLFGSQAGYGLTTGSSNTFVGASVGYNVTTGSNNVAVGGAIPATAATAGYQLSLGAGASTNGDNAVAIGRAASAEANCFSLGFGNAIRMTGDANGHITVANTLHAKRYTETVANAFNTSLAPSSGTLTVDTSVGNAVLGALNAAVTTWAFTNVSTDNSKVTTVTAVLAGNASYTYGDACSVNGSAVTNGVMWSGGSAPTATAGTDIITFIIVKDSAGTVKVFGSATTNFS